VVEQAKKLVTLAEFNNCQDDEGRIQFLYERIYQRLPRPEETKLGLEFIAQSPEPEKVASEDSGLRQVSNDSNDRKKIRAQQMAKQQLRKGGRGNDFRKRPPLKAWEEYTHALLQANEASFVN
jgi:hypothetical protein